MLTHLKLDCCFGINVLGDEQEGLSIRFSKNWDDRFAGVNWYRGRTGVPLLFNVAAIFECAVAKMIPGGDHMVVIGRVQQVSFTEISPLMYVNRSYNKISQSPNQGSLVVGAT